MKNRRRVRRKRRKSGADGRLSGDCVKADCIFRGGASGPPGMGADCARIRGGMPGGNTDGAGGIPGNGGSITGCSAVSELQAYAEFGAAGLRPLEAFRLLEQNVDRQGLRKALEREMESAFGESADGREASTKLMLHCF